MIFIILGSQVNWLPKSKTKNIMRVKTYGLIAFFVPLLSCASKENTQNNETIVRMFEKVKGEINNKTAFDQIRYTILETNDSCLFGEINKLEIYNGQYYILDRSDRKKIFVFSKNGKFIRAIGSVGKGPGEYNNVEDFTVNPKTGDVVILSFPSTVCIYNNRGVFVKKKKLTDTALLWSMYYGKNGYVFSTNHQSVTNGDNGFLIFCFDEDFNLLSKSIRPVPKYVPVPSFIKEPLFSHNNTLGYFDAIRSCVYKGIDKEETKKMNLDLGGNAVPLDVFSNTQKFYSSQRKYCFYLDAICTDENIVALLANKGNVFISFLNIENNSVETYRYKDWFPNKFLLFQDGYIYSTVSALTVLEDKDSIFTGIEKNYSLEADSNPVIVSFKQRRKIE
jgi:hypothetical protein